jgi:hypothetical protein
MEIYLILLLIFIICLLIIFFCYNNYNKYIQIYDMEWNVTPLNEKIILYSTDYEYLIELTPQIPYNSETGHKIELINIINRNNKYEELRSTDYKCNIFRKERNFKENDYLILNTLDSSRYNIISYKGLPKIYRYEKKESNPYYSNPHYGFYGTPLKKIDRKIELNITDNIINKFITKNTYFIPEYMILY